MTKTTLQELKKLAKIMGLKGYSKMNKADLTDFILGSQEAQIAINFDAPEEETVKEEVSRCSERYSFPVHEAERAIMRREFFTQQYHEAVWRSMAA